jgi:hypothetical protein
MVIPPVSKVRLLWKFGERPAEPQCRRGVDCDFVVAAAQILHEGVPADDHLCRAFGA